MKHEIVATYVGEAEANAAVRDLLRAGIPRGDIELEIAGIEEEVGTPVADITGAGGGALYWGLAGAVVGGVLAILVSMGQLSAPVFDFISAQPLVAALQGMVVGGATASLFGFILGMGMWQEDGEPGPSGPVRGERLLTVRTEHKVETVKAVFRTTQGRNIQTTSDG